jgi:hypothetical protein
MGRNEVDFSGLGQELVESSCEHVSGTLGSIKCCEVLELLRNLLLLKKGSTT